MNRKKIKLFLLPGIIFSFLLKGSFVFALEVKYYPPILGLSLNSTSTFPDFAKYFFNIAIAISVSIAAIVVAIGGISYLISYSRGSFTGDAKDRIKAGLLGLFIILTSYIIVFTINPDLINFKLLGLKGLPLEGGGTNKTTSTADMATYKEIPMGILTETLLSRKTSCYGFDPEGNPVEGEKIKPDNGEEVLGPTFLDHDRADCFLQMIDGAQKRAQVVSTLSDKLIKLMDLCDCSKFGNCGSACSETCNGYTKCPGGQCNPSPCIGGACKQKTGNDCCPTESDVADPKNPKKKLSVKALIESGPIKFGSDDPSCDFLEKTYAGLDELRSQYNNNYERIKNYVEKKFKVDKVEITTINIGECNKCTKNCTQCNPNLPADAFSACDKKLKKCEADYKKCVKDRYECQKKSPWFKLRLVDQMTYFQGKINEMQKGAQDDIDKLKSARDTLNKCYLAEPYINLLKKFEETPKPNLIILTDKPFKDPVTDKPINVSKYCQGFNYANSSCFKKCGDMCPDTSQDVIESYKKCDQCNKNDAECLKKQKECVEKAYNERPCLYDGKDTHQKFKDCIASCQDNCTSYCSERFMECSTENRVCKDLCKSDSSCVVDNPRSCLLDAPGIKNCVTNTTDIGNTAFCIDNNSLCKNGSSQNAGYPECTTSSSNISSANIPGKCSGNAYSATFLYGNLECQKCPQPNQIPEKGTACYIDKGVIGKIVGIGLKCQEACPEVSKCPTSSDCPYCPCDRISDPKDTTKPLKLSFTVPNAYDTKQEKQGSSPVAWQILGYQIVGPQCNKYSYNDDPLTFYCPDMWWENPSEGTSTIPTGTIRSCEKANEIPVGQAVDDALNWANWLIKTAKDTNDNIVKKIIENMRNAGEAKFKEPIKNYCRCDAKFETNKPICKTDCEYTQEQNKDTGEWKCKCGFVPCKGKPCEQVSNYLINVWNYSAKLKTAYLNLYTSMLNDPRSDVLKELTYSREKTNECSVKNSAFAQDTKMINCTRAVHELIPPIRTYKTIFNNKPMEGCYGESWGADLSKTMTDNWFCCQKQENITEK